MSKLALAIQAFEKMLAYGVFATWPPPVGSIVNMLSSDERQAIASLTSDDLLGLRFQRSWANRGDEQRNLMLRRMK